MLVLASLLVMSWERVSPVSLARVSSEITYSIAVLVLERLLVMPCFGLGAMTLFQNGCHRYGQLWFRKSVYSIAVLVPARFVVVPCFDLECGGPKRLFTDIAGTWFSTQYAPVPSNVRDCTF